VSVDALPDFLQNELVGALEFEPCKHPGCDEERFYTRGAGAGMCKPHGLQKIRDAQARGVEARKSRGGSYMPKLDSGELVTAARRVLEASRKLERANRLRNEAAEDWRVAVRILINEGSRALQ
jgi:hypothetical protein